MLKAFLTGLVDGWRHPHELGSGMTYPDQILNEAYDHGVNVGQAAAFMLIPRVRKESA